MGWCFNLQTARDRSQGTSCSSLLRKSVEMPGTAGEYSLWFDRHEADRSVARKHKAKRSMVFIADEHQALNSAFKRKRQDALIITLSSFATTISQHGKAFGIGPGERVYDFASYDFDIAWLCIAIPVSWSISMHPISTRKEKRPRRLDIEVQCDYYFYNTINMSPDY